MTEPPMPAPMVLARLRLATLMRGATVADLAITGAGYAFGPASWSSSPTLAIIRALPPPIWAYGVAELLAAALIVAGFQPVGHVLGAVVFTFWGLGTATTIVLGSNTGWGGPFHYLALAMIHLGLASAAVWDRSTSHRPKEGTR